MRPLKLGHGRTSIMGPKLDGQIDRERQLTLKGADTKFSDLGEV